MNTTDAKREISECLDNLALIINTADPIDLYDYYSLLEKVRHDVDNCYAMIRGIDFGS